MTEPTLGLMALVVGLGVGVGVVGGILGIGGGIVLAPALLYLPPLVGVGNLDMKATAGLTITHSLATCLSGTLRHRTFGMVHTRLVLWMGGSIFVGASLGALASHWVANATLLVVFAGLAAAAAVLMAFPKDDADTVTDANTCAFDTRLAVLIGAGMGCLGGMVGQSGSFLLVPLMLQVLKLPTRVVVGSNLAIAFLASFAGFAGKAATHQIPFLLAACLVLGAVPGAQLGGLLSHKVKAAWLRRGLAVVVAVAALRILADVCTAG
ncbi:MAG: sulfite exporter TauE/SafE family protein [Deltaproteobacteria bacterium]|nr:sulfite exporter TauE/SafE family protein [Deltaproteobacteria bacterium]